MSRRLEELAARSQTMVTATATPLPPLPSPPQDRPTIQSDDPFQSTYWYWGAKQYIDPLIRSNDDPTIIDLDRVRTVMAWFDQAFGLKTIYLVWCWHKDPNTFCSGDASAFAPVGDVAGGDGVQLFAALDATLDEAVKRGMKIIIGLSINMLSCPSPYIWVNKECRDTVIQGTKKMVSMLESKFPRGTPKGDAWEIYFPDEVSVYGITDNIDNVQDLSGASYVRDIIRDGIRAVGCQRPVHIAPYIGGSTFWPVDTPKAIVDCTRKFIQKTGIRKMAWQDSGGMGSNIGDAPDATFQLKDLYGALHKSDIGDSVIADLEIPCVGNNDAGPIARFANQVVQAGKYPNTCWELPVYGLPFGEPYSTYGSARFFAELQAWLTIKGKLHQDYTYQWLTSPSPRYPDPLNNKLRDWMVGSLYGPNCWADPAWIGFEQQPGMSYQVAHAIIKFKKRVHISYVAAHLGQIPKVGVFYPHTLQFRCLNNENAQWPNTWYTYGFPPQFNDESKNSEFVLCNPTPIDEWAIQVELWIASVRHWIFISELNFTSVND